MNTNELSHINNVLHKFMLGGFPIEKRDYRGKEGSLVSTPQAEKNANKIIKNMKEEISLELAELGNLKPKHEPMTQNDRQKSEREKSY